MFAHRLLLGPVLMLALGDTALPLSAAAVHLERVPLAGLQPQIARGTNGEVHLVFLAGDARASDVFYARRADSARAWSEPIRVNSQPGSAIAVGTIRGAQLALGSNQRPHILWNGSGSALPQSTNGSPLLYARMTGDGTAFEPQRNLMTRTRHLDGGAAIAADDHGQVYVAFHASPLTGAASESTRAVYLASSSNEGRDFAAEFPAGDVPSGVCSCCGLQILAEGGRPGVLSIAYRAAREKVNRDMMLLRSHDGGKRFTSLPLEPWQGTACPMSSTGLSLANDRSLIATWETGSQVQVGKVDWTTGALISQTRPTGTGKRKHPRAATNRRGEVMVVWTEGTGWNRGGSLEWQRYDARLQPVGERGRQTGLPAWTFAAVMADAADEFIILY